MSEKNYLWFICYTISKYEQKVAKDLSAITINMNLSEIVEIIVPMKKYTTHNGIEKEKPKFPNYFYIKIQVDANNQPPINIWHKIRNTKGCIGLLQRDGYMISMDDSELKKNLNLTDEDISSMSLLNKN